MLADKHQYVLLADSTGKTLRADFSSKTPYISWEEALPFLTRPELRESVNVWFAFGYDINMLGKWESKSFQEALYRSEEGAKYTANDGTVYHLKYIPRKILRIKKGEGKSSENKWVFYDVWGFFQAKFEQALDDWKIGTTGLITEGKQKRQAFKPSDMDFMVEYNAQECKKLVDLMNALNAKLEAVHLVPTSWHGAGAIASRLLAESKCGPKFKPKKMTRLLDEWQRYAYFGGRIELVRRGKFKDVFSYDINSAYPHSSISLPALNGRWERCGAADLKPDDFALVEVVWDYPECKVGPLPFRLGSGYVIFPSHGAGIYHNVEVQAALKYVAKWKLEGKLSIKRAIRLERPYDYPLRDYVNRRAKQRLEYKKAKDFAHIPIKLGLNALYGKFAQRPQYQGHKPQYRQLLVAGYITAHTRAELLLKCNPDTVILFATDSIKSLSPLDVEVGENLGQWEPDKWSEALFLMAGVYAYFDKGAWHNKTRGLHELDIHDAFAHQIFIGAGEDATVGPGYTAVDMQFMGVKRCLANYKAYPEPCRFYPLQKSIDWNQNNKRDHWSKEGESWPMSEFEEKQSAIYTAKFDEMETDYDE